ncbi:hypothetical protein HZB94_01305 [Candidatus Falkowbacteria bacterium]|nr:hypothetical protein [Candidatus Falkowbacteria bacterium]
MGKQNGKAGDRVGRDKSRGGMRNVPLKGDSVGGNILELCALVDELIETFETRVASCGRYVDFSGFPKLCSKFSGLLAPIKAVDSAEAQTALQTFWGEVAAVFRGRDEQAEKVLELDGQLQTLSEERVRGESRELAQSKAEEFMKAMTTHLSDYHRRLDDLIKRYKALCVELENKKKEVSKAHDTLEEQIETALSEIEMPALPTALHYANSRCVAVERLIASAAASPSFKEELKIKAAEIEKDLQWMNGVKQKIARFFAQVDELRETINVYREAEGIEIQKSINDIKTGIRVLFAAFEAVGQGATFWGCVYGLHEVFDYAPPDLLIYCFAQEGESLPIEEIEKCRENLKRVQQLSAECANRPHDEAPRGEAQRTTDVLTAPEIGGRVFAEAAPAVGEVNLGLSAGPIETSDDDDTDEPGEATVRREPQKPIASTGDRQEDIARMVLCVLWSFIEKNIQQAQQAGKTLVRGGDFGRTTKVVSKLLFLTGWVQSAEKKLISDSVVPSLAERGLVKVSTSMAPTKNYRTGELGQTEQTKLFLTNIGRLEVVKICDSHRAMMNEVLRKQEEREAAYKVRRGISS